MDSFIDQLMSQMTVEEKIGQLNLLTGGDDIVTGEQKSSSVSDKIKRGQVGGLFNIKGVEQIRLFQEIAVKETRLGIPMLFGMDVIHGYKTIFPIPLGLAATWDMKAIEESARIAAIEASADGICWTFSPMVDISRDARWGRFSEGNGEDPYLGGEIAKAMVRGYQGTENPYKENTQIMACVKHYALYGASEAGRDYNTVDMSRQRMFNEYMYPYQAAVDAGVGSVMASFNVVEDIPATANKWLLEDVLRKQWGFDGFVVTDYTGINEMVAHGIGDLQTVSARSLNAGIDMDMVGEGFFTTLPQSLKKKKITEKQIDQACRRVLEAKYKLGLFEDPYKYCTHQRVETDIYTEEHRTIARNIAAESFVLLKNEGHLLPLGKQKRIALVGPLANTSSNMPGTWSVAADLKGSATILEGLKEVSPDILYAKGSHLTLDPELEKRATLFGRSLERDKDSRSNQELIKEALTTVGNADVIIAAVGEASEMNGESSSRVNIDIPDAQRELLEALSKTGKPIVLLLFTGRPLTLSWENQTFPAILNVWFGGSETAFAATDVLFGDKNPCGKLTASFPQHVGQMPLYYSHKNTGRPLSKGKWFEKYRSNYLDVSNEPLFPFGYGLSYTTFEYGEIQIDKNEIEMDGEINASITVKNTGKYDGYEIVQLYICDLVATSTRPVKELKDFAKIFIKTGESQTVSFKVNTEKLKYYNHSLEYVCEPGEFHLMIGTNSRDVKMASFMVN